MAARLLYIPALVIFTAARAGGDGLAAQPAATQPVPDRFEQCTFRSSLDGATVSYASWLPPAYDAQTPWPLIVFLHGSAEGKHWKHPTSETAGIPVRTAKADLPFVVAYPLMRGTWSITSLFC